MPNAHQQHSPATGAKKPIDAALTAQGARIAAHDAREFLGPLRWVFSNLPGEAKRGMLNWFAHVSQSWKLMDRRDRPVMTQDAADALRTEFDDAFAGCCQFPLSAAVVDTVNRFQIPKQFLFEVLHGADLVCRFPQPENYEQLQPALGKFGGGAACGAAKILGAREGYEPSAIQLGSGLLLAYWLVHLSRDLAHRRFRFPKQDYADCGLPPNEFLLPRDQPALGYFVRLQGQRIEELLKQGSALAGFLGFDGNRSLKAIVDLAWETVVQLMLDPQRLIDVRPLANRFPFMNGKRWRFYLGIETAPPFWARTETAATH